jgi:hypothetical protein
MSTLLTVDRINPHVHTVGGKRDTETLSHPSLLTAERDTTSRPYCCWWKGIHPHFYIVDYGKGYTLTSTPPGSAKGYTLMSVLTIHPHVHTVEYEYTLTFTPCWWWKGYTLNSTHTLTADSRKENILTSISADGGKVYVYFKAVE